MPSDPYDDIRLRAFHSSTTISDSVHSESLTASSALYTTSSHSTAWGPGTLAGKGIYAFGKKVLRGIENIVVYRKLPLIAAHFPHKDDAVIDGIDSMYCDLLELSR
jgi:hypothetical protein